MIGSTTVHEERLRSGHHFVPAASKMLNEISELSICATQRTDYERVAKSVNQSQGQVICHLAWVLDDSSHPYINGDLLLHQSVSAAH